MPGHDIIVIGASAGGIPALQTIALDLPPDLDAAILVVVHLSPWHESRLAEILDRSGPLRASKVLDSERIMPGRIYVAPPNGHIVIEDGHVEVWHGPRENSHRPAINPLFRSAALIYGPRVAGVILSGSLDDGTAGLWWIKRQGGVTIVQDPKTAEHPDMPNSAIQYVDVDYVVPLDKIAVLLAKLVSPKSQPGEPDSKADRRVWNPGQST